MVLTQVNIFKLEEKTIDLIYNMKSMEKTKYR